MKDFNGNIVKPKVTYSDTKVIDLKHIHKQYDGEPVLKDINLYIRDKEFDLILYLARYIPWSPAAAAPCRMGR